MSDLATLLAELAGSWLALWLVGLAVSFRMIAPTQSFLSERSVRWVTRALLDPQTGGLMRRFSVGFKRYVDRIFDATPRRLLGCRFWTLRYRNCAFASFLTFQALFWLLVLATDRAVLLDGLEADVKELAEGLGLGAVTAAVMPEPQTLLFLMLGVGSVLFGAINTLTDYISFLETRNVLARMGSAPGRNVLLVLLDLVLTSLIAVAGVILAYAIGFVGGAIMMGNDLGWGRVALGATGMLLQTATTVGHAFAGGALALGTGQMPPQAMILSTYLTSIWIWVFFTGALMLRAGILLGPVRRAVVFLVDVEAHPFRAVWLMFALAWTALLGVTALV